MAKVKYFLRNARFKMKCLSFEYVLEWLEPPKEWTGLRTISRDVFALGSKSLSDNKFASFSFRQQTTKIANTNAELYFFP